MTSTLANAIQTLLRGIGLRTINRQFFFSYSLIFLCAAVTAGVLFLSPTRSTWPARSACSARR